MSWDFGNANYEALIRRAPYVDLESFKERLIEKCDAISKTDMRQQQLEDYKAELRPTLPAANIFEAQIHAIMKEDYADALDDPRYGEAFGWIHKYFFCRHYWKEIA